MPFISRSSWHILPAAWLAGCVWSAGAVEVAGTLLVDLKAADFSSHTGKWPQHTSATGIPGDFVPKGSPTRQKIAGADAVVFDGDGDFFVGPFTTAALHAPGAKHSVEIWVYQGNIRDQESVVSWGKRWGRPDMSLAGFRYGGDPEIGAIGRWGESELPFAVTPPPGQWHHIVYTYNGTRQEVYVDGQLDISAPAGLLDAHDMLPIHLGLEICGDLKPEGQFTHFSGALGQVRIHSDALRAEQVKRNYIAEKSGYPGIIATQLSQLPLHRFSFDQPEGDAPNGTLIADSIGGLHATVRGNHARFTGNSIELPGGPSDSEAYLDFPNGLISSHESPSLELWVTQTSSLDWSRIVSIGTNKQGEIFGPGGSFDGSETLTLFGNVGARRVNRFARSFGILPNGGPDRDPVEYLESDYGIEFHHVITYNRQTQEWQWYRNGLLMEVIPDFDGPTSLDDVNVWLGRSEFSADNNFPGAFNEVRFYKHSLTEGEIQGNFLAGPDRLNVAETLAVNVWKPSNPGTFTFGVCGKGNQWEPAIGQHTGNGPGTSVTFAGATGGEQEISINQTVTLGSLNFGSSDPFASRILHSESPGALLVMDSGSPAPATIQQASMSPPNHIRSAIQLKGDTEISNQSVNALVIDGDLLGKGTLVKTGIGTVVLTGDCGAFTGMTRIASGSLLVRDSKMLAASPIDIRSSGMLVMNHSADFTLRGGYSGSGRVTHQGKGSITLARGSSITCEGTLSLDEGSGTFTSEGDINGPVEIATDSHLVLKSNSKTILKQWLSVGRKLGGNLTIQDNASVEIEGPGHVNIGDLGTGLSTMSVKGGSLKFKELFVGKNAGMSGIVLHSGGRLHKTGMLDTCLGGGIPGSHDAWGYWHMSGGVYQDDWNLQIGSHGTGVMEMDGGKVNVVGFLGIGRYQDDLGNASRGVLDVRAGTVTTEGPGRLLLVGEEGTGILNIRSKGNVICRHQMIIGAGTIDKPGQGTVNLMSGGTLTTGGIGQFNQAAAYGTLNVDGGTLVALRSNQTFVEGIDAVYIRKQGLRIDTNGHDVGILLDLRKPEGNGVVSIPVIHDGSDYRGTPWIGLTGGATAVPRLVDGSIKSIIITDPGNNYADVPSVSIIDGGCGSGLELGSPVLAPNVGGGLTKTGKGTLTLGGKNTYPGNTIVEQGQLKMDGSTAGGIVVESHASLTGGGVVDGSVEIREDAILTPDPSETLSIRGDLSLHGTLSLDPVQTAPGKIAVAGKLDLTGSKLILKSNSMPVNRQALVIAQYDTLSGNFTSVESLPENYRIDYAYLGMKQIALVGPDQEHDAE